MVRFSAIGAIVALFGQAWAQPVKPCSTEAAAYLNSTSAMAEALAAAQLADCLRKNGRGYLFLPMNPVPEQGQTTQMPRFPSGYNPYGLPGLHYQPGSSQGG